MMLCTRCQKRPAVVFITRMEGQESKNEGLCLTCAKELGIKPVDDMLNKFGISDEDMEQMEDQFSEMMTTSGEDGEDGEDGGEDSFSPGGAPTFPFLQNMFGNGSQPEKNAAPENAKTEKPKNKKDGKKTALETYCVDLTEKARSGQIDAVIGRDREIYRAIQILSRRNKNNPCLIGEPGVGKTAIAEGLAQRIVDQQVPPRLLDKQIHLLDLTALVAGTQFRGQFESRIKALLDEVKRKGNVILFIDEVHNLVGAGDAEGSMSAANIMKPALSRGEIQVIGATTFEEYRKHIEKDAALERRFQPITVEEPSIAEAITILAGIKGYYEQFHGVKVTDDIARQAVVMAERYISDRFLPDKAIDLLDEACAAAALANTNIDAYAKKLIRQDELKKAEEAALAEETVDYEKLATVRSELLQVEEDICTLRPKAVDTPVTDADLAKVVELWTGIPATRIRENELEKLSDMEGELKRHIIGQDEAVHLVAAAVRRSRVHISPRRHPASFIFVGPTGVGKTELVKVLAAQLFDTPETLIRLDMSEYMDKYAVSRIVGAPPGYVGYDEAGQLTEKVRRKPYSVILFDEIEKAHPDVLNILLQILDEGHVTDAHGRTVNFENTVIVMTSNAGSQTRENLMGFGQTGDQAAREKAEKALSEFLRPEFISRVDEIVYFHPLTQENMEGIAALMLRELVEPLTEKGIAFTFSDEAVKKLAEGSEGNKRGARDLRNRIRREVEDKVASLLVDRQHQALSMVSLTVDDGGALLLISQ